MPTDLPYLPTYTSSGREPFHISPPPTKSSLHDLPSIQLPPPLLELRTELVSRSQHLQETRSRIATLPGFPPTSPFALAELADVSLPKHLVSDRFHHITRHYLRRRKGPPIFAPPPCSHCILLKTSGLALPSSLQLLRLVFLSLIPHLSKPTLDLLLRIIQGTFDVPLKEPSKQTRPP